MQRASSFLRHLRQFAASPLGILPIAAGYLALVFAHLSAVPFYDGAGYALCIREAVHASFALDHFRCGGHSSMAYLLLLALPQYFDPGNPALLYLMNAVLGLFAITAFWWILRFLSPPEHALERLLATAVFAFSPLLVVHLFAINLDFGLAVFLVLLLGALLLRLWWGVAFAGTFLLFTKETGIGAYILTLLLYALCFGIPRQAKPRQQSARVIVLLPLVLLAFYALWLFVSGNAQPYFGSGSYLPRLWRLLFGFSLSDISIRTYLVDIFVLNFQWIFTAAAACLILYRLVRSRAQSDETPVRLVFFLTLLLLALLYLVTRIRLWNDARYVLLTLPVLLLLGYAGITTLISTPMERCAVLTLALVLVLLSNFRTIDPLSRLFFRTFPFGDHSMLAMATFQGMNRDEIVYNLESLKLASLTADLFRDLKPKPTTVFATGWGGDYSLPLFVSIADGSPSLKRTGTFRPLLIDRTDLLLPERMRERADGKTITFIEFPNLYNQPMLDFLLAHYRLTATKTYEDSGYRLRALIFDVSAAITPPPPPTKKTRKR